MGGWPWYTYIFYIYLYYTVYTIQPNQPETHHHSDSEPTNQPTAQLYFTLWYIYTQSLLTHSINPNITQSTLFVDVFHSTSYPYSSFNYNKNPLFHPHITHSISKSLSHSQKHLSLPKRIQTNPSKPTNTNPSTKNTPQFLTASFSFYLLFFSSIHNSIHIYTHTHNHPSERHDTQKEFFPIYD